MDSCVVKLVMLLSALTSLVALTPEECQTSSDACQAGFIQSVQQQQQTLSALCNQARSSLLCVRQLACGPHQIYLRIALRTVPRRLSERGFQGCDMKDSLECHQKKENCTNSYVDQVLLHETNSSSHATMLCQSLNTFAACQIHLDSCGVKNEEVVKVFQEEKTRLVLPDCALADRGTLNTLSLVLFLPAMFLAAINSL